MASAASLVTPPASPSFMSCSVRLCA